MEPLPGQKIKVSNNCSNTSLNASCPPIARKHSLPSVTVRFKIMCVVVWPCYISSSHKHWQSQFTQKHTEEWCKCLVSSKRKSPGMSADQRAWSGEHRLESSPYSCCWGLHKWTSSSVSCQQTQRKITTQNHTAKVRYSWEQRLDLSAVPYLCYQPVWHHRLAKCLLLSALTGPPYALALKKRITYQQCEDKTALYIYQS